MANNVISVIQPGGSSGDKYNVRATGLRYFPVNSPAAASTPTEGYISLNSNTLKIACADITELWAGMTLSFTMPSDGPSSLSLQINSLTSATVALHSGLLTTNLKANKLYVAEYSGSTWTVYDDLNVTSSSSNIVANSDVVPTSGAVYDFVNSKVSNRWEYVVSNSAATTPQGAQYWDGTSYVTGTLAASAGTEYQIYLVRHQHDSLGTNIGTNDRDYYDEWITVKGSSSYYWEKIGNTDIDTADIAAGIVDTIIGSIADHSYVKPSGSGSVTLGTHNHTFTGSKLTSTGNFTPSGTITVNAASGSGTSYTPEGTIKINDASGSGTSYTPAGSITVGGGSGASYTPAGSVTSTFTGTDNYVKFTGTADTISMSTSNVVTGNPSAKTTTVNLSTASPSPSGYSGIQQNVTISGTEDVKISTSSSSDGSHSHTISNVPVSVSAVNGSNFTVSTQDSMTVTITSTSASSSNKTFQVPIASATVSAQPAFTMGSSGTHTHSVTTTSTTSSGTLSNVGAASSYTVSGEVLTLTPSTTPGSSVSVSIPALSGTAAAGGDHKHTLSRSTDVAISVTGGYVKLTASAPSHNHTLSGSVTPIGTANGNTGSTGEHSHIVSYESNDIAGVLNATVDKISIKVTMGNHTHTIASMALSTSYTPSGTLASGTSSDGYNVKPSGTIESSFTGTGTDFAFSGDTKKFGFTGSEKKLAFSGTQGTVSVIGTPSGTVGSKDLGSKTVSIATTTATLTHTKKNS